MLEGAYCQAVPGGASNVCHSICVALVPHARLNMQHTQVWHLVAYGLCSGKLATAAACLPVTDVVLHRMPYYWLPTASIASLC